MRQKNRPPVFKKSIILFGVILLLVWQGIPAFAQGGEPFDVAEDIWCNCTQQEGAFQALLQRKMAELNGSMSYAAGGLSASNLMPSTGSVRILVLPIEFRDYKITPDQYAAFQDQLFGKNDPEKSNEEVSAKALLHRLSYGKLDLDGDILPLYTADGDRNNYASNVTTNSSFFRLIREALDSYFGENSEYNLGDYDADGDGCIDALIVKYAGPRDNYNAFGYYTIHTLSSSSMITVPDERIQKWNLVVSPYWGMGYEDAHELGHCMGLRDTYYRDSNFLDEGLRDLMSCEADFMNVYFKYLLGWVDPLILTDSDPAQKIKLYDVAWDGEKPYEEELKTIILIPENQGLPVTEFYMAEYRSFGYRGEPGIIIWHCDAAIKENGVFENINGYLKPVRRIGYTLLPDSDPNKYFYKEDLYTSWTEFSSETTPSSAFYDGTETGAFLYVTNVSGGEYADIITGFENFSVVVPAEGIKYGSPTQLSTIGGKGTGALTYEVLSGDAVTVTPQGMATPGKVGDVIVMATKAGDGIYEGDVTKPVTITVGPRDINTVSVSGVPVSVIYTGQVHKPVPVVTDSGAAITSDDYDVSYGENIAVGEGTVTLTGKGNYTGSLQRTFTIERAAREISTAAELRELAAEVNGGHDCSGVDFKLTADIDLGGEAEPFIPIGNSSKTPFCGMFDGNGHKVTGLYVDGDKRSYQGLFGHLGENGSVKNLGAKGLVICAGNSGGIVGANYGIIKNCYYAGDVRAGGGSSGGIVGANHGIVQSCYNAGEIWSSMGWIGGVAATNNGTIENCYNIGTVTGNKNSRASNGNDYVGGVVGFNSRTAAGDRIGNTQNCYNFGNVTGMASYVGGVMGALGFDDSRPAVGWLEGTAADCYYLSGSADGGIDSADVTGVAEGKTVEEFQKESTFANWDFDTVWMMSETLGRPVLRAIPEETHTHDYATAWSSDETDHWHECSGCDEKADFAAHAVVIDPAVESTCTTHGKTEGSLCSVCGYIIKAQTETPLKTHSYPETWSSDSINHWRECSVCKGKTAQGIHAWNGGVVTTAPTSTKAGVRTYTCTVCQQTRTETIPATGGGSSSGGGGSSSGGGGGGRPANKKPEQTAPEPPVEVVPEPPVEVTPEPVKLPFADVAETAWYYEAVQAVYGQGIMTGMTETLFEPELPTSRGMVVTMLYRMEGEPTAKAEETFTDVPVGRYYADAVAWAVENGIVTGYGDGTFRPDTRITREQLVTILYRYWVKKGYDVTGRADLSGFFDEDRITGYARESVEWANATGLLGGADWGGIDPGGAATRGQVAAVLERLLANRE